MQSEPGDLTLSILMPVRNEGSSLRVMLRILPVLVEAPHEVLIVHDDPDDDSIPTATAAQASYPQLRIVHNRRGRGVINAIRSGVETARGKYVLIFAADEIGPVFIINDLLKLMQDGCDLASVTRYAHGGKRLGGSWIGGKLSRSANYLYRRMTGCATTDLTTGIKMFRRELFESLELESRPVGWAFAFEMAIKAQMKGCRLGEVPVVSIDRLFGGTSSFRLGPWTKEYLRWFVWGLRQKSRMPRGTPVMIGRPAVLGAGSRAPQGGPVLPA